MSGRSVARRSSLAILAMVPALAIAFALSAARADTPVGEACGSEVRLESILDRDPEMARRRALNDALLLEAQRMGIAPTWQKLPGASTNAIPIYTIPTVVHIIHTGLNGDPENISDLQVQSQIVAANRDLQNTDNYPTPANDARIQLCLVSKDPNGNSNVWPGQAGITRHFDATATLAMDQIASETAMKAYGYFPSNRYLNVWVVKRITVGGGGGVVGFATFPGSVAPNLDGIVMDYRVTGSDNVNLGTFSSLLPTYNLGKIFAHEVGHYLDLYHTFHQGCLGDQVSDTPPEAVNFTGCPQGIQNTTCNSTQYPAPYHNFMDYTNDPCRWEFTQGQQVRMFAALGNPRAPLVSASNLVATGACPPTVIAIITASPRQQCVNQPINFSAPTCGGSCTYTWTFQGGSGSTSGQNTSATFASPGPHIVTLTVSDGSIFSNAVDTVYVSACTPITGPCANWVFGNQARLNFASGMPVAVAGNYRNTGPECATQISNSSGALLFYTDNDSIWNVNHVGMAGGQPQRGKSSHTGALAIPRPNNPGQYYLLSVKEWEKRNLTTIPPLAITTIDMNLNGGLGGVTFLNTAVALDNANPPLGLLEGVTAIPQCDGINWWVITCGADSVNIARDWERFIYVSPLTANGVVAGTTQVFPSGFTGAGGGFSAWGTITASRDGNKIAVCQSLTGEVHVFDFNRNTGAVSNLLNTGNVGANQDVEFSPNGQLIYFTTLTGTVDIFANGLYGLKQMNLSNQHVRTLLTPAGITKPIDVQLGPDDKIYVARSGAAALDVINFPNQFNNSNSNECGYNKNGIPLGGTLTVNNNGALPNTVSMCSVTLPPASFTYSISNCKTVTFKTPNCSPFTWNFGDGPPTNTNNNTIVHPYQNFGTYTVMLTAAGANPTTATQQITLAQPTLTINGPGSACGGPFNYSVSGCTSCTYNWTITGGSPPTAKGDNVFVNWGLGAIATISVTATDTLTGCQVTAIKTVDPCTNCNAPPSKMVAWWPLDELGVGTLAQEIVGAHDGADIGAPTKAVGAVSNARYFNGTTQYVRASHHPKLNLGTGNFTIDAWIKTGSNPTYAGIVEKLALAPDLGYALYLKTGQLALRVGDGTTSTEFLEVNAPSLIDGLWHHVAVTEDRNNASAGTTLYVDGAPYTVLPAFAGNFTLDNGEDVLIGAKKGATSPESFFAGGIDEVEIFTRALGGDEIAKIYGSGAGGKCKEYVWTPLAQTLCAGAPFGDVKFYICNGSGTSQNYTLTFAGTTGNGCTVAGPTMFTILSQNTNGVVNIGTGCHVVDVRIFKPNGMGNGDVSCYQITATSGSNNVAHTSNATITANDQVCPRLTSKILTAVNVGVVVPHTFQIQNTSLSPQIVNVQVDAIGVDQPPLIGGGVVSLNGQPPGSPWFTSYALAPGESTQVHVDAEFVEEMPFVPYDIVLATDIDGNFAPDARVSAGMINSEAHLEVTGVPPVRPPLPSRLELVNVGPNPFHRLLAVQFDLPWSSAVRVELFDVGGRRVRSLAEPSMPAGRALRILDAGGLASGVYLLRLEAGGQTRTRNVVLLKD